MQYRSITVEKRTQTRNLNLKAIPRRKNQRMEGRMTGMEVWKAVRISLMRVM